MNLVRFDGHECYIINCGLPLFAGHMLHAPDRSSIVRSRALLGRCGNLPHHFPVDPQGHPSIDGGMPRTLQW